MSFGLVDIVNAALVTIGETPIMSIDDNSPNAIAAKAKYPLVVKEILRSCDWNCARGTAKLSRLTHTPSYSSFQYAYQLPSDYVRIIGISLDGKQFVNVDTYYNDYNNPPKAVYDIEGDTLFYDGEECIIKYTKLIDVSKMDIGCTRVLEAALAYELSYNRVASAALAQLLEQTYRKKLRSARFTNGLERNPSRSDGDASRAHRNYTANVEEE